MNKILSSLLALSVTVGITSDASAKSASDGYVLGFVTIPNGVVFFTQSGTISGSTPTCDNGGIPNRWGFDSTTRSGQALLSILLTAKNTHEVIRIVGSGLCSAGSSSEYPGLIVTDDVQ